MKDLIRQILREYTEPTPILIYEIVFSDILGEQIFIRQLHKDKYGFINLYKNKHSMDSVGSSSSFQRIDPDEIDGSIMELQPTIIKAARKIMETCTVRCSINVIDNIARIDYHMWLEKNKDNNNIKLIINTSIRHPNHLKFRIHTSPTIIVDKYGNYEVISTRNIYN